MKLLIADDHTLFKDTLVEYIRRAPGDFYVSMAEDLSGVMKIMDEDPAQDLAILDLRMPGMNGMEGIRVFRDKYPSVPVALMSGQAEEQDVQAAMDLGAAGYFPKTLSGKALLKAIQLVLAGEKFIPIDAKTDKIMPAYRGDPKAGRSAAIKEIGLTPREVDVLDFLLKGASNKEIANDLGLQVVTVKLHIRGVCKKLGAKNRTQAALKAKEKGL